MVSVPCGLPRSYPRCHATARMSLLFASVALAGFVCDRSAARGKAVEEEAIRIVSKYKGVFTGPPRRIPTNKVVDAPLLGNGDIGVAIGGAGESQSFFIGKNDFWSRRARRVITVGRVNVHIPGLAGASYACEQDLLNAEVRGSFAKGNLSIEMRSWTAATENLLVTELSCRGPGAVPVVVNHSIGPGGPGGGGRIRENNNHINIGREQHGGGRWGFRGLIDEVRIYDRALSNEEIKALSELGDVSTGLVRHWKFDEGAGAIATDAAGKGAHGQVRNAAWTKGRRGGALRFDGKGHVDCGKLKLSSQVTIAAWIYVDARPGEANYIVSKGEWSNAYSLGLSAGKLRMAVGGSFVQTPGPLATKKWLHVAGTYDGSAVRVFVDGAGPGGEQARDRGSEREVLWFIRAADRSDVEGRRTVAVATRLLGTEAEVGEGGIRFELRPGGRVHLVTAVLSDLDDKDCLAAAKRRVSGIRSSDLKPLNDKHREWWQRFWSESFVEIGDPVLEKFYYGSHYVMASCSRKGKVPPGLFGNWITTDRPAWAGDFHLNYNHEAPWWGMYSSNHIAITEPYDTPILEFMPQAKENARRHLNCRGVYYPVGIGPWGIVSGSGASFWGQKSNAAYAATNMLMRFYHTYDREYATRVYPYLVEVADFWEDYLKFEGGRYVIYNDAIHEGSGGGKDFNAILSLGLVRMVFRGVIDMSTELARDAGRRKKWKHVLEHISKFPLQERAGKTVFRYTERGTDWWRGNTLGIQHIWPAGTIGLDSDPKLLSVSRDTITVLGRWRDNNGFPTFYTAAARVGYDPNVILDNLRGQCGRHGYPNLFVFFGGGGIECCCAVPSSINEMLLQSHEGVLRLFPVWPRDRAARFGRLRAVGAFLVSGELKDGVVRRVTITSEKGRDCTVQNPWPGRSVTLHRNDRKAETLEGARFSFETRVGERLALIPR